MRLSVLSELPGLSVLDALEAGEEDDSGVGRVSNMSGSRTAVENGSCLSLVDGDGDGVGKGGGAVVVPMRNITALWEGQRIA